jgi:hypothetical protein
LIKRILLVVFCNGLFSSFLIVFNQFFGFFYVNQIL